MISFKQFVSESIEDKGILKAIFIVGIPGAGKSYTASKLNGTIAPKIVNTDRATEFLTKKTGETIDPSNWPKFKDRAHSITKGALGNYLNSMLPLFVDGTSNDASNILQRAGILESLGYDVGMIFIDTQLKTAIERANARVAHTGRKVGEDFIRAVEAQAKENKEFFQSKFKFFKTIDNNDGELTDAALKKAFNEVQQFYEAPVSNPVGKRNLYQMKKDGMKYLNELMDEDQINKKLDAWYK